MSALLRTEPWWYWALAILAMLIFVGAVVWVRDLRADELDREAWARQFGGQR